MDERKQKDQGAPPAQSKLIIDRARWLRGGDGDQSALLRRDGKMCCLGFFGRACGLPPDAMMALASPDCVEGYADRWPSWLLQYVDERGYYRDTKECEALIRVNDGPGLDSDRELRIATIFAKHGIEVEFVEDAAQPPKEVP